jgi:F-type H+-transporting ATPase subunit epsilon
MATFRFELVAPERLVFSGDVEHVVVPGAEGEFGVMAGHAPFVSTLKPGILKIKSGGGEVPVFVRGGFAEAGPSGLTVLAETSIPIEELNPARLAKEIKNAEDDVADAKSDAAKGKAQERLDQLKELKAALGH